MTDVQRRAGLRLWLDGRPLDGFGDWVLQLEVDERANAASTMRMTVDMSPVSGDRAAGDWDVLEHGTFADEHGLPDFRLLRRVTVQFGLESDEPSEPEISATVFDGYVTGVEPVFGESRVPDSMLILSGMDASCLMHFETVTRAWRDMTDAAMAQEIFEKYGFAVRPAGSADATVEDGGLDRVQERASLLQRGTDAEFLRLLARRNGFEVYLEPAQGAVHEGAHPGTDVVGHFHSPRVDIDEQPQLALFPRDAPSLIDFRARYDSHQPTRILGWHIDEQSRKVQRADVAEPGYGRMGSHSRADVLRERLGAIQPVRRRAQPHEGERVATAQGVAERALEAVDLDSLDVPHTGAELSALARAELRLADWFVAGSGTVQCERYPAIVRSRRPVGLSGAGQLLDGRWYVQGVRHRWGVEPDDPEMEQSVRRYEADLTLVRNALGGPG
jgi:hypothetical protein